MGKKKLYGIIAAIIVIIGGIFAYNQHQEHQKVLAEQQEKKEFKEFCNNNILANLNKCVTLNRDIQKIGSNSKGRNFENLFKEINIQKEAIAALKQAIVSISATNDKQKEIRSLLSTAVNYVDIEATNLMIIFEKQRSAQGAEGWNQEEYDRYVSEREEALKIYQDACLKFKETSNKIGELAGFTLSTSNTEGKIGEQK